MVAIRELKYSDFALVNLCISRAIKISNSKDYPHKIIEYMLKRHETDQWISSAINDRFFIVAEINSEIVGTGALKENNILHMFVDPDYQNKGIGSKILKHIERKARKNNFKKVIAEPSLTAIGFYLKSGYQIVKDEEVIWLDERIRHVVTEKRV